MENRPRKINVEIAERCALALKIFREESTYAAVARRFGVSFSRARQIVCRAIRYEQEGTLAFFLEKKDQEKVNIANAESVDEFSGAEMSFRRGFDHGAYALFVEIEDKLPASDARAIRNWFESDLKKWREKGKAGRPKGFPIPSTEWLPPPISLGGSDK